MWNSFEFAASRRLFVNEKDRKQLIWRDIGNKSWYEHQKNVKVNMSRIVGYVIAREWLGNQIMIWAQCYE